MKTNFKISQCSRFLLRLCDSGQNLIITKTSYFFSIRQENTCKSSLHLNSMILTDFNNFKVNEDNFKISQLEDFCYGPGMRFWSKFANYYNFLILFHYQENTLKSSLHSNLNILTDFHSFTVNEEELQN